MQFPKQMFQRVEYQEEYTQRVNFYDGKEVQSRVLSYSTDGL